MEKMKENLLEVIQKMVDFNINTIPNKELAAYYKIWFEEIKEEKIKHPKLIRWLKIQIDYWNEKDRKYSKYLEKLIEGIEESQC